MSMFSRQKVGLIAVFALAFSLFFTERPRAQAYLETYGQNRVQYRKYSWKYFDTKHFRIYHYDAAGRQLARYIAEQAEKDIVVVEKRLGGEFPHRFNIVLYNNYDEYRQTNVGLKYDSQFENVPAGTVDLVGDRLVVYFTGIHSDLRRQLRSGMSRVVMERMLFGESFRQMVKNAVLLNLPAWTTDGFIAYLVDGWDAKTNNDWKNLLEEYPHKGFYELGEMKPELAGKAFWKFVTERYGETSMKNLLYTMELKSSLNEGIKMVFGQNVKKTYDSCVAYYKNVFAQEATRTETPDSASALLEIDIPKETGVVRTVKVSPRGNDVAYVSWKYGEYQVYIQKTENEKTRSLILEGGRQDYNEVNPDPNYPLLAWSNNGYKLAMVYKKGTQTRIRIYSSLKAKIENYIIPPNRFDRVTGLCFMENDDKLVLSAIKKSQTDLYEFTIKGNKIKNITNDAWDDTQPWFVSGGAHKGILFLSNRPQPNMNVPIGVNELPVGPMNVFFYDTKTESPVLMRCTNITKGEINQPIQYGNDNFAYLYDLNGVQNKYVVMFKRDVHNMDSAYSVPVTNYSHSLLNHQYNPASKQVADVMQQGDKMKIYFKPLMVPDSNFVPKPLTQALLVDTKSPDTTTSGFLNIKALTIPEVEYDEVEDSTGRPVSVMKSGNAFQSEFTDTATSAPATKKVRKAKEKSSILGLAALPVGPDSTYLKMKADAYRLNFKPDFFTIRLDNSILFNKYQSVRYNGGSYSNPDLSGLLTVSLNDALENHRFTGGFRLPINFSGFTYFLEYENFTRRTDWGVLYMRTQNNYNYAVNFADPSGNIVYTEYTEGKLATNIIQGYANFPLDRIRSVRMTLGFRTDALDYKAIDTISLTYLPRDKQYWTMSRVEYVFDNSTSPTMNIHRGFRYKFFGEYMYQMNDNGGGVYNVGTDFRFYQKLYRNAILATRLAGAHSGGEQKILYTMGGVDNWINPQYSNFSPSSGNTTYAFQALATSMRGYPQNARNGNTYAVFNGEVRVPIFSTFTNRPIQSAFLRHMQVVGFMDVGSAWNGLLPNADANTRTYTLGPDNQGQNVILNLNVTGQSGLAMGYGAGLRTMLLSYFMRLDAAWNIEGRTKPIWYFSLGTDF